MDQLSVEELAAKLEPDLLPKHVAIIMDGNGRWAELRSLPRIAGHREGIKSVREMITVCLELGIHALTIYAFSQENWNRPIQEISSLMGLLEYYLSTERAKLIEQGVRLRTIGRLDSPPGLRPPMGPGRPNRKPPISTNCISPSPSVMVDAPRSWTRCVSSCMKHKTESCSRTMWMNPRIQQYLYTHELPDPDLLIRTSGETRISNFLLWQLAYTELYFTPTLWPDFRRREFLLALLEYQRRERRFGRVLSTISS